jgi:hypothetical protein
MEYIHARDLEPVQGWQPPPSVVEQMVCRWSGLIPNQYCPQVREIFYYDPVLGIDYRPNRVDTYYTAVNVNSCNNTLATPYSPPECVTEKVYFSFPPELQDWAETTPGVELPPTVYDTAAATSPFGPVVIVTPAFLGKVSGFVEVRGNAEDPALSYFRLDVGAGSSPTAWQQIGQDNAEGGNGIVLGSWDTRLLPDGLYTLRLTVVRQDSTIEVANREVIVDNTPPTVRLTSLDPAKVYSAERDVFIELVTEPADNIEIDTVDFYLDGELIATTTGPYTYRWEITRAGEITFWAVVTDAAGNQTESERIAVRLGP